MKDLCKESERKKERSRGWGESEGKKKREREKEKKRKKKKWGLKAPTRIPYNNWKSVIRRNLSSC